MPSTDKHKLKEKYEIVSYCHDRLLEIRQEVQTKYKETKGLFPPFRYNLFVKIAKSTLTYEKSVELWALGTQHFRQDLTKLSGIPGVVVKNKVIDAWRQLKDEGRKSLNDKENLTKSKSVFKDKKEKLAREAKSGDAQLLQELQDMANDFAKINAAMIKLRRAYDRSEYQMAIFNYFRMKRRIKAFFASSNKA